MMKTNQEVDNSLCETIEDILGEFGFRLVWSISAYWADVKAYEITSRNPDGTPNFNREGWGSLPDPVPTIDLAEMYLDGRVRWDGCSELDQGCPHWCVADQFKRHCNLLRYIYERAFELMDRDCPDPWNDTEELSSGGSDGE